MSDETKTKRNENENERKKRNVRPGHTSHAMLDPQFVARRIIYPQACNFASDSAPCEEQF